MLGVETDLERNTRPKDEENTIAMIGAKDI